MLEELISALQPPLASSAKDASAQRASPSRAGSFFADYMAEFHVETDSQGEAERVLT